MSRVEKSFIYCATDGAICKVGWTIRPRVRLYELRAASKRNLRFARVWSLGWRERGVGHMVEQHVHVSLGHSRRDGEWYDAPAADLLPRISFAITDIVFAYSAQMALERKRKAS